MKQPGSSRRSHGANAGSGLLRIGHVLPPVPVDRRPPGGPITGLYRHVTAPRRRRVSPWIAAGAPARLVERSSSPGDRDRSRRSSIDGAAVEVDEVADDARGRRWRAVGRVPRRPTRWPTNVGPRPILARAGRPPRAGARTGGSPSVTARGRGVALQCPPGHARPPSPRWDPPALRRVGPGHGRHRRRPVRRRRRCGHRRAASPAAGPSHRGAGAAARRRASGSTAWRQLRGRRQASAAGRDWPASDELEHGAVVVARAGRRHRHAPAQRRRTRRCGRPAHRPAGDLDCGPTTDAAGVHGRACRPSGCRGRCGSASCTPRPSRSPSRLRRGIGGGASAHGLASPAPRSASLYTQLWRTPPRTGSTAGSATRPWPRCLPTYRFPATARVESCHGQGRGSGW